MARQTAKTLNAIKLPKWRDPSLLRHPLFGACVMALVVALLYAQTLHVPLYLDDVRGLVENYRLRDLTATLERLFSQRGLSNLTFALNYRLSGWSLPPLHLVNILLHAGCGILAWRILLRLLPGGLLPLLGALLFVAHPLQTQGVTYLIQRSTVLAAFLLLLAFLLYLQARTALAVGSERHSGAYLRPYLGALLAGAGAVLAKENTATLPLLLLAYDRLFPLPGQRSWRQAFLDCLPFCAVPLAFGVMVFVSLSSVAISQSLYSPLASLQHNSPLYYLVTQFSVLWIYLRLLVLPYGQALEHNYPVVAELVTVQSGMALAGLLMLGWGAWRLRQRFPLLAFGGVWFCLTLAVESSIIPLDPLFEHRLYLPMFGGVLVLLSVLPLLLHKRGTQVILWTVLLFCAALSWQRNNLWNDPLAFYEENLRVAPDSERVVKKLSALYRESGREAESLRLLERVVATYPASYFLYGDLAKAYAGRGQGERALALLETGMVKAPGYAALYEDAAAICKESGDIQRAIGYLQRGLAVEKVEKGRLLNALGLTFSDAGASSEAVQAFLASLTMPAGEIDRVNTYMNLAREYYYQERWQEVFSTLQKVLELNPGDPEALERLGEMAMKLGDRSTARKVAGKLEHVDADAWRRLQRAMRTAGWLEMR